MAKLEKKQARSLVILLAVLLLGGCLALSRMPTPAKGSLPDYLDLSSVDTVELNTRGTTSALTGAEQEELLTLLSQLRFPSSQEYRHTDKDERAIRKYDPPGQEFTLLLHDNSGDTYSVVFVTSETPVHISILSPDGTHIHIIGPFEEGYGKIRSYVHELL